MTRKRLKIEVEGTVQGIGFRPFIYKEAANLGLTGHVYNHSSGITIEAEGSNNALKNFIERIQTSHPPFAKIHAINQEAIVVKYDNEFKIITSRATGISQTLVSPDISTCNECLNDINNPENRRHRYPFTNCTNCGPRYTIIEGVPYDRPMTSMKNFKMCPKCKAEYTNPLNRRYHAQPNCCANCGPSLALLDNQGIPEHTPPDIILKTIELITEGRIIAIKGIGGFHLACDATNEGAVSRLRERKKRDEKPFAVMMPGTETVRRFCELSEIEESILASHQRPIVLLKKLENRNLMTEAKIAEAVAPNNCYLGVMLPYTPLHHLLFKTPAYRHTGTSVLIMTSANISDEPICFDNDEALEHLKDIADYFLIHNRNIYIRTDDSITRVMDNKPLLLRRARGYSPHPIILKNPIPISNKQQATNYEILAVGAELKNTICLLKGNKAFISQHIGDLENTASYESFKKTIGHMQKLFDARPTIIAHDMHTEYFSTKWARSRISECTGIRISGVQHHHAHIASCMVENQIDGQAIGIALDGTGYGTDNNIWGGEILIATYKNFERTAHFEYIPQPGGDAAVKNPWQMALSYLGASLPQRLNASVVKGLIPSFKSITDKKIELVLNMIQKGIRSPLTSSCGRLFDAVASIIGLRNHVTFEGQAALELEMLAHGSKPMKPGTMPELYEYIIDNNTPITISYKYTLKGILEDMQREIPAAEIALKFHNTVVSAITEATVRISQTKGIKEVALSGGCFQNTLLTEKLKKSLEDADMTVYTHSLVPPNDGGISLGQAVITNAKMEAF